MTLLDPTDVLDEGGRDDEERHDGASLTESLQALPALGDDIYLRFQAFNLGLVDNLLTDWERDVLSEYHRKEGTPTASAIVVGAVGQLWVFGIYELLRTWRQRGRELLAFADELAGLDEQARQPRLDQKKAEVQAASADPARPNPAHLATFERVARDPAFPGSLRDALDRSEWPFRKLEALRVHLAKHENPKAKGSYAMAPGYARIDEVSLALNLRL